MVEIIRPTLVIDKEICLRNIERMVERAREHHLLFRPHFKTHQSAEIGEWFRGFGVHAITVSSVRMAEYFSISGWKDITVAFPMNILEFDHIKRLAANISLNLTIENKETAELLTKYMQAPVGIYIKVDTGYNRTGIGVSKTSKIDAILEVIADNKYLRFKGFLTHNGQTYTALSTNEIFSAHYEALLKLKSLKQHYKPVFPEVQVTIGDTPSCSIATNFNGVDEIRPGNFVFYDLMQMNLGVCSFDDIAARLICPVVARHPSRNEVVIYGGAIHLSKESLQNIDGKNSYGRIVITRNGDKKLLSERNYVARLSQEHGILKISQKNIDSFKIGDLVEIIPVHSCLTANLSRNFITSEGEEISTINS
jgi:D-serine deaminase-like pyridoxal phosphate-dependent protein